MFEVPDMQILSVHEKGQKESSLLCSSRSCGDSLLTSPLLGHISPQLSSRGRLCLIPCGAELACVVGGAGNEPGLAHNLGQYSNTELQPRPTHQICKGSFLD